jgi:hypothetical protein
MFLFVKNENVKIIWINYIWQTCVEVAKVHYGLCAEFWDKLAATTIGSPHDVLRLTPVLGGYLVLLITVGCGF